MSDDQKTAIIHARCTAALIRAIGMHADNMQRAHRGESMAYTSEDFERIIKDEGVDSNTIYDFLRH